MLTKLSLCTQNDYSRLRIHKKGDDNETVSKIFWRAFSKCDAI